MLNFVIGTAGTGKTTQIMNRICELAKQGKKCIYIVPEQYSKTGETLLFSLLDRESAPRNLVQLHSFTSLKIETERNHGKLSPTVLNAAGKAVMVRRAIINSKNVLKLYGRQADSFAFAYLLAGTFDDLERSGFMPGDLSGIVAQSDSQTQKLREISLLYSDYRGLMGDKFCDEEDVLKILAEKFPGEYTDGQNIFIDGFEHFSYGQLMIIKTMIEKADAVTVSLTADSAEAADGESDIFYYTKQTARTLTRHAGGKLGSLPKILSPAVRFKSGNLALLDEVLQGGEAGLCDKAENSLFVTRYPTRFEEVCRTVAQIRKLVREENYSYNDIAIVSPQPEKYEHRLQESLSLAGIPYFIDEGRIVSTARASVFFGSVLKIMAEGLNEENSAALLHTGFTGADEEKISLFENYLFVWQNTELDFSKPFTLSPEGIKREVPDAERENLAAVNEIRRFLYGIFGGIVPGELYAGGDLLKKCYELAQALGAEEKAEQTAQSIESDSERALFIRLWDVAVNCLDTLNDILSEDVVTAEAVRELYSLMLAGTSLEFSPQTQDCVMITKPKRMKLDAVKAVFVLGAAEDSFPAAGDSVGLITDSDREALGLELDSDGKNQTAFENLYFYKTLTTAREKLYISFCENNIGERQQLSSHIQKLKNDMDLPALSLGIADYAVTADFFADYVSGISDEEEKKKYIPLLKKIGIDTTVPPRRSYEITHKDNLRALLTNRYDKSMQISPTSAERYYECPFEFFMQSVLRARPIEKARFDARTSGTYLHFIVEIVLGKYGENFYKQSPRQIEADLDEAVKMYTDKTFPPEIRDNPKFVSQYENMKENAKELLYHILEEQKNGLFRPVAFEKKIGKDGIPPMKITTDNGNEISIRGVVDRVDIYRGEQKDYLRVVDYKTGSKSFDERDIASGLSSQLLVYMNGLLQSGFEKGDKPLEPGAVMYQRSEIAPKNDDENEGSVLFKAVGMALNSREILDAFGNGGDKNFGVIRMGARGITKDERSIVTTRENFDKILSYVTEKIKEMGDNSFDGVFPAVPLAEEENRPGKACAYCIYAPVCMRSKQVTDTRLKADKSIMYAEKGDE